MKFLDNKMDCRVRENSDADVDEIETKKALREENNRKRKVEEVDSKEELKNFLFNKGDDVELSSDFEMDLLSDDEDEPLDNQGKIVTIFFFWGGGGQRNNFCLHRSICFNFSKNLKCSNLCIHYGKQVPNVY